MQNDNSRKIEFSDLLAFTLRTTAHLTSASKFKLISSVIEESNIVHTVDIAYPLSVVQHPTETLMWSLKSHTVCSIVCVPFDLSVYVLYLDF